MSLDGSEGGWISRANARQGINTYKASAAYTANQGFLAHYFGRDFIDDLLAQSGCVGLRVWYGIGPDASLNDVPQLYIVGVDSNGDDILPLNNPLVADFTRPCPPMCPNISSLDS